MKRPLRIGLMMLGSRGWTGGLEYTKNIIFALHKYREDTGERFEFSLIINESAEQDFIDSMSPFVKKIYKLQDAYIQQTFFQKVCANVSRIVFRRDYAIDKFMQKTFDFVFPYFTENIHIFNRYAAWIGDFQHKYMPEFFKREEIEELDCHHELKAKKAPAVVLSSKTAGEDFRKFHPEFAYKRKILPFLTILRPEWFENDPMENQRMFHLPDQFFLVCNQFWQHKNHQIILEALGILKKKSICPIVVCTGHIYDYRNPGYSDRILKTIHASGLAKQFLLFGLIEKIEQIQLVRRCLAVIQPSLFEGWSSVVEDARCLGKPILLSEIPVHIEQNPPYSRLFDPHSAEDLALIMADAWNSLSPGPDKDKEEIAQADNIRAMHFFAKTFLEIARSCAWPTKSV